MDARGRSDDAVQIEEDGVEVVGAIPSVFPSFEMPSLNINLLGDLAPAAFAIALVGLLEAVSIARAIAIKSGQELDGNQEFIGQGLSNTVGSLFQCYAASGSFTRSVVNFEAGAKTPLAAVMAALDDLLALDDDRRVRRTGHVLLLSPERRAIRNSETTS